MSDMREISARWRRWGRNLKKRASAPFRATYFSESRRQGDAACLIDEVHALVRLGMPLPAGLHQCATAYRGQRPSQAMLLLGTVCVAALSAWVTRLKMALVSPWDRDLTTLAVVAIVLLAGFLGTRVATYFSRPQRRARIFHRVAFRLEQGDALSEVLAAMPRLVPRFAVDLVRAGETSGRLPEVLERIQRYFGHEADVRQSTRAALLYLSLVGFAVALLSVLMLGTSWPVLEEMLREMWADSQPEPWVAFVSLQESLGIRLGAVFDAFSRAPEKIYLPFLAAATVWLFLWLRWWQPGEWTRAALTLLPYGARFRRQRTGAQVCAALGPMLAAGVPLPQALANTVSPRMPRPVRRALDRVRVAVESGTPLSDALRGQGGNLFPPSLAPFVALGEQSGAVAEAIDYLADFYTGELYRRRKMMSAFLVPCGVLALGCVVLAISTIFVNTWTGIGDALFYQL